MASSARSSRLLFIGGIILCTGVTFAAEVHRAILSRVPPNYPELARRMHIAGKVVLVVTVKPDGTVSGTRVESGHIGPESTESTIDINFTDSGH